MAILANLAVRLGLNSAEFKAGLDDATKNLKQFEANQKKALKNAQQATSELMSTAGRVAGAIGIAIAAIGAIAKKSDEISDMADAFDASIGSIIGMGKAMDQSGGSAENLSTILTKLSTNAQNAREGSDQLRDSFRSVGITAGEVENLKPDELFDRVARQLAKIEDPTMRSAKAIELLGKSAKGIDWNKYVEEYKKVADPDLAAAIRDAGQAWDDVQKGLANTYYFAVKLIQPLIAIYNALKGIKESYNEFKTQGGNINFDPNNPMAEGIEFKGTGEKPKEKALDEGPKFKSDKYKVASAKDQQRTQEIAKIKEAYEARVKELSVITEQIQREGELIGLSQQEQEMKKLGWKFEDDNAKMQADLQRQINEEKAKGADMDQKKIDLLKQEQENYAILSQVMMENAKIAEQANIDKVRSQQILTDSEKQGFDQLVNNMAVFGQKSKAAFAAWKAMAIAQTIIDTYKGAQESYSALASIPYVGPALGIAAAVAAIGAGMVRVNAIRSTEYQGRAVGGSVVGGTPYLVGEHGPEIMVPHGSGGTVIPNNRLGASLGSSGPVFNGPYIENLSAIDTKSFEDMIYGSNKAVWAANQYAGKNLSTSRTRT